MSELISYVILIVLLGVFTSVSDIKSGKIYNWQLLFFFSSGITFSIFFLPSKNIEFIYSTLSNFLIALLAGFFLWNYGVWTAGDGKLFTLYSFIIPLSSFDSILFYFSAFNLLVNTFTPIFLFLFFLLIFKTSIKEKITAFKKSFSLSGLVNILLSFYLAFLFFQLIGENYKAYEFFAVIFMFAFFIVINKLARYGIIILAVLSSLLSVFYPPTVNLILLSAASALLFFFAKSFLVMLGKGYFIKEKSIAALKPGDIPVRAKEFFMGGMQPEGITTGQITQLSKFSKQKNILLKQTLPFAPFLFLGALLCIFLKSNIIIYLINLF